MDALALIRDVGVPVGILMLASIALWRSWSLERRLREADLKERTKKLAEREDELYALYRALALRELEALASKKVEDHSE